MSKIALLDQNTINKIAAGEVVERPASVVKELVENAIDAEASAVTVEIKDGGISFIRITDNGSGIDKEDIPVAFLKHSTSKIRTADDLLTVGSLGFRGEALSSISSVSQVELITKTRDAFMGVHFEVHGGINKEKTDIGCPDGTTIIVRNLFYNVPARQKFLKTAATEAGYISDYMERLAVSHPEVAFKFINNNKTVFFTSGNGKLKDNIYAIYGRDIAMQLEEVLYEDESVEISGYIAKPVVSRGNRNYENYFINGRYVKNSIISKAIEEAYKPYMMQHKYPFTCLNLKIPKEVLDVNVHPAKLEIRIYNSNKVYYDVVNAVRAVLAKKNLIPDIKFSEKSTEKEEIETETKIPEPFEKNRLEAEVSELKLKEIKDEEIEDNRKIKYDIEKNKEIKYNIEKDREIKSNAETKADKKEALLASDEFKDKQEDNFKTNNVKLKGLMLKETDTCYNEKTNENTYQNTNKNDELNNYKTYTKPERNAYKQETPENFSDKNIFKQETLFDKNDTKESGFLDAKSVKKHKIIGQLFLTYWLVEFENQLYIIDQHAAHEKILFENTMLRIKNKEYLSQMISPPAVITLSIREAEILKKYMEILKQIGFGIEHFGGKEYLVNAVPADMYGIDGNFLLMEIIDGLVNDIPAGTPDIVLEKVASMSCKAAVKGNSKLSEIEAKALIDDLMKLENPFHCPHGRPVIVSMTKYELEKKFRRVI